MTEPARDHVINGCTIGGDDPDVYLNQAHGILAFITSTAAEAGGFHELSINDRIIGSAIEAVETLVEMASQALVRERALGEAIRLREREGRA